MKQYEQIRFVQTSQSREILACERIPEMCNNVGLIVLRLPLMRLEIIDAIRGDTWRLRLK